MQLWPANEKAFAASFVAARSRSASAATTTGVELPSSSRTRFFGARSAMPQPTPLEPVNVIIRTRSSSTRTSPISAEGPTSTVSQPAGRPASCSSSASSSAESGVALAGFSTTGQPAASAGASLCATRLQGKLKGEIAPITPTGRRRGHRDDVTGELPRFDGGEGIGRDGPRGLDARGLDRLAGLGADRLRHVLVPLAQQPGDAVEDRGPLVARQRRLEGARCRVDCPPGIVGSGLRRTADDLTAVRGVNLDPLFSRRRHMLRSWSAVTISLPTWVASSRSK